MSRGNVELDFFGMEKEGSGKSQFQKLFNRQRSFRGFQSAISKISPEVLKSVIESGSAAHVASRESAENGRIFDSRKAFSVPSTPKGDHYTFHSLPVFNPLSRATVPNSEDPTQMTIFYNGTVSVFDVPGDKAESIFKLAEEGSSKTFLKLEDPKPAISSVDPPQLMEPLDGDLPIARRKSLQRFLEKRKERLTSVSPYACHTGYALWERKPTIKELM